MNNTVTVARARVAYRCTASVNCPGIRPGDTYVTLATPLPGIGWEHYRICASCFSYRAGHIEELREARRAERSKEPQTTPTWPDCPGSRHGNAYAAQRHKCRCPEALRDRRRTRGKTVRGRQRRGRPDAVVIEDRMEAVASMTRWGRSANEIAERLGVDSRTVVRYRAKIREMTNVG